MLWNGLTFPEIILSATYRGKSISHLSSCDIAHLEPTEPCRTMPGKRKAVSPGVASTKKPKHSGKGRKPSGQAGDETLALLRILCSNKENKNSKGNKSPVPKAPVPVDCSQRVNQSLPPCNEAPQQHPGVGHASHHGQPVRPALNPMAPAFSLSAVQPYVNIQPNPQFTVGRILATHVYDGKVFVKGGSQYRSTTIYNTDDLESYIQNNPTYAQRTNPNTSHQRRGTSASAPQNKRSEHHAPGGRMADIRAAQRESQAGALRTAAERLKTQDASSNTASVPTNNLSNQGATPHLPSQPRANLPANQLPDPASQSSANQSGSAGAMMSSDPDKTVPMGLMGTPFSSEMTSVTHDIPPAITTKTPGDEGAQDSSMELDSTSHCVPPTDAEVDTTGTNQDND